MKYIIAIIAIAFLFFSMEANAAKKCGDFNEISIGANRVMANNVWDRTGIDSGTQCIFSSPLKWEWNWVSSTGNIKSYPSIIYGKKPWRSSSTIKTMPVQISAISNFQVSVNVALTNLSGGHNTAFDLWVVSDKAANVNQIVAEVMIWGENNGFNPSGSVINSFEIDGRTYDLYKAQYSNWVYYAFKAQDQNINGVYDIKKFLDTLVTAGELNSSHYLADVEFGNEIQHGTGLMSISSYSVYR